MLIKDHESTRDLFGNGKIHIGTVQIEILLFFAMHVKMYFLKGELIDIFYF